MRSCGFKSHLPHDYLIVTISYFIAQRFLLYECDMRKCRNWQTSKTKDLVSIALVWVQVPSSALFNGAGSLDKSRLPVFFAYNQILVTACIYAQKILCKKLLSPAKCSSGKRSFYFFSTLLFLHTQPSTAYCVDSQSGLIQCS